MRAALLLLLLAGCHQTADRAVERRIQALVREDGAHLANLEATYGVAFTSATESFFSDKLYIRRDIARVYYGHALDAAEIRVARRQGRRVLLVRLSTPARIATDRRILSAETSHDRYKPEVGGEPVDVEKVMNEQLDATIERYRERTLEMTKAMSREYFASLAHRFDLELDFAFRPGSTTAL
jgi:hypothetical protein